MLGFVEIDMTLLDALWVLIQSWNRFGKLFGAYEDKRRRQVMVLQEVDGVE